MCVFLCNKASGCANAPSPLTGLAIVCARVRTMRRRQLWTNVHNPIPAAVKSECSQFNSSSTSRHNCARMSAIRDKIRDTGGIVIVKLLLDSVKGKNVADKGETLLLMTKAMSWFFWPPHCNDEYFFHQIEWSRKKASRVNGKTNLWSGWTVFRKNAIHESWRERVYMICCSCSFFCASSHWLLGNVWPHW